MNFAISLVFSQYFYCYTIFSMYDVLCPVSLCSFPCDIIHKPSSTLPQVNCSRQVNLLLWSIWHVFESDQIRIPVPGILYTAPHPWDKGMSVGKLTLLVHWLIVDDSQCSIARTPAIGHGSRRCYTCLAKLNVFARIKTLLAHSCWSSKVVVFFNSQR